MKIQDFLGWMEGKDGLVVAPGPSALEIPRHRYVEHWTLACNRAVTFCEPDFVVCMEPAFDRVWQVIRAVSPLVIFTHVPRVGPRVVEISTDVTDWLDPERKTSLRFGQSPFFAAAVAIGLGFRRVGLVGVDFERKDYPNKAFREEAEAKWGDLLELGKKHGTELLNLNPLSRLEALPRASWDSLLRKYECHES